MQTYLIVHHLMSLGQGTIECSTTKDIGLPYTITGIIDQVDETTIEISELPVRKWTEDYKEFLDVMMNPSDKNKEPFVKVDLISWFPHMMNSGFSTR